MKAAYYAIDTETGDLDPKGGTLLTMAMSALDEDFNKIDCLDFKFKAPPGGHIVHAKALEVNKIKLEDLEEFGYTYEGARSAIQRFCKVHGGYNKYALPLPLGHNIGFDLSFIRQYLFPLKELDGLMSYHSYDTITYLVIAKSLGIYPKNRSMKLSTAAKFFGLPDADLHNARADIDVTVEIAKILTKHLKQNTKLAMSHPDFKDIKAPYKIDGPVLDENSPTPLGEV